ncbi:hypothetical protein LXL04_036281 [Taraxacum kok-saghyz]
MSTKSSIAQVMAWNWVIQSLSSFKQVDPSTLTGIVNKAPPISDDSREMVSLQVLESLFVHGNEPTIDTHSSQTPKISFDPSEQCEQVLHKILEETSEPMTELERKKWNVHPFVMHKRASLPRIPLQKLKEELLEGSHPLLASLKEMSNLGDINIPENSQNGQNSQNAFPEVNVDFNDKTTVSNDDMASINPPIENNKLQHSPLDNPDHLDNSTSGITNHIKTNEHEMSIEPPELTGQDANIDHGQQELTGQDDNIPNISNNEPSDNDKDDEMIDIFAKKEAFINSQYTLSQDSMATFDSIEVVICMKCNKGGRLLICSSDTCQIRVHKRCLGSSRTVDEKGKFFCPFCVYSHAISKYLEVKKKASLARKNLQVFISSGVKHRPKTPSKKGDGFNKNK